ncbi:hypothetical protein MTO96_035625 [Rhipicephalus appendiculatus]
MRSLFCNSVNQRRLCSGGGGEIECAPEIDIVDSANTALNSFHDSPPKSDEWVVPTESSVCVRNYGVGEKWTPGQVKSTSGSRMVTVQSPNSRLRRHMDQVPPRHESQSPTSPGIAASSEPSLSMRPEQSPGSSTTSSAVLPAQVITGASTPRPSGDNRATGLSYRGGYRKRGACASAFHQATQARTTVPFLRREKCCKQHSASSFPPLRVFVDR